MKFTVQYSKNLEKIQPLTIDGLHIIPIIFKNFNELIFFEICFLLSNSTKNSMETTSSFAFKANLDDAVLMVRVIFYILALHSNSICIEHRF